MKGTLLNERSALGTAVQRAARVLERAEQRVGQAALNAFCAFALSALSLGGRPLPLAACLIYAAKGNTGGLGAAVGAAAGYALFFGTEAALEPWTLCICFLIAALLLSRTRTGEPLVFGAVTAVVGVIFAAQSGFRAGDLLHAAAGAGAAAALPLTRRMLREETPPSDPIPETPDLKALERAGAALETMHEALIREAPPVRRAELAEVFDFASDQVCRCCTARELCWEHSADDTYRDLCAAGEAALPRGVALREDFSLRFRGSCRHMEGFLTAVNQALDLVQARRREAHRTEESRMIAAGQYMLLAGLLRGVCRSVPRDPARYSPELAVGSSCRSSAEISGDRGAACKDRFGNFYVLLCDGMGSGTDARSESDRAARLLTALLEAGAEADSALAALNGFFALRSTSAFSTVDLLRLNLRTGAGCLYKWGAAPSYLRTAEGVKKIGTATPPPGVDASQLRAPGQYALSLQEGETLVMVSDGACGEETQKRLADFTGGSVRDLASCLIALGEAEVPDDRTVAVLRLSSPRSK